MFSIILDEKENTSNNQPEKVELSKKSTESKSVSPSKEKSTEIVEAMDTEISSPRKEKKKVVYFSFFPSVLIILILLIQIFMISNFINCTHVLIVAN